jgi:hypothetical protein
MEPPARRILNPRRNRIESLCRTAELKPGDRVKTLRGTTRGTVIRLLEDGRILWKVDASGTDLIALPESLIFETPTCPG